MISFVYFDMGGVVIQDFSGTNKWAELQKRIGITPENQQVFDVLWKQYRNRICIDVDVDTLIPIIEKECHIQLPTGYSLLQDFVDHFEINTSIWPVIQKIQKTCRIGLLTNAYPRMLQKVKDRHLLPPIKWDIIIDSANVGYQKPDRQIYEIAERKAKIKKDEIFFVENTEENVRGASDFGWQTFLYDSSHPEESSRKLGELFK